MTIPSSMQLSVSSIDDYSKCLTTPQRRGIIPTINYIATPKQPTEGKQKIIFYLSGTNLDDENRRLSLDLDDISKYLYKVYNPVLYRNGTDV